MKSSKRFLTLLLALVMLVGVFTVAASATTLIGDGGEDPVLSISYRTNWPADVDLAANSASQTIVSSGNLLAGDGWNSLVENYTLIGWSISPDGSVDYAPGATYTIDGTEGDGLVLYAVWKKNSVPSTPLEPALPSNPTNTTKYTLSIDYYIENDYYYSYNYGCGYEYENWYDGDNYFGWCDTPWFNSSWDSRTCDNHYSYQSTCYYCNNSSSKTSYSYNSNYSCSTGTTTSVKLRGEGSYVAGQRVSVSASSSFTYRGVKYYFAGWYGSGTFANRNTASTIYTMPARNATIYAVYTPSGSYSGYCSSNHTHTVVYTDGVAGQTVFADVVKTVRHNGTTPTIKDPTRAGYTFVGWSPKVSTTTTKCTVYEAQWSKAVAPKLTDECVAYLKGYGKGEFRPANNMTRGEFAVLLYRLLDDATLKAYKTTENDFADVSTSDWYNEAISTLANAGVIEATKNFEPKDYITRAEMVAMLAAFYTTDYTTKYSYSCNYKDVPSTYWAYNEISLAQQMGWVKGYGANTFLPDATITRAEVAAIINRVLDRDCNVKDTKNYVDVDKDAWYYADVLEATIAH